MSSPLQLFTFDHRQPAAEFDPSNHDARLPPLWPTARRHDGSTADHTRLTTTTAAHRDHQDELLRPRPPTTTGSGDHNNRSAFDHSSPGSTAVPEMISRAGWDARPPQGEFVRPHGRADDAYITLAVYLEAASQAPARMRQHQRFHQDDKGWPDIAYHYVIDSAGRVFEGRPVWAKGDTGTSYDPAGHFLVCCEADFNQQSPTQAQIDPLVSMLAWGAREFGVDAGTIKGHRDYAATTCPGANLAPMIDDGTIEALVRERL